MTESHSLGVNEAVLYKAKIHWAVLLPSWLIVAAGFAQQLFFYDLWELTWTVVGLGVFIFFNRLFYMTSTRYLLTNRRVIFDCSLAERQLSSLLLRKCETVSITQDLFGSIFGYGTVLVSSGNQTVDFACVVDPVQFKLAINTQIDLVQGNLDDL